MIEIIIWIIYIAIASAIFSLIFIGICSFYRSSIQTMIYNAVYRALKDIKTSDDMQKKVDAIIAKQEKTT